MSNARRRWVRGMHMAAIERLIWHTLVHPNDWQAMARLRNHASWLRHWWASPYYAASAGLYEPKPIRHVSTGRGRPAITVRAQP